jgi:hypothetical protein
MLAVAVVVLIAVLSPQVVSVVVVQVDEALLADLSQPATELQILAVVAVLPMSALLLATAVQGLSSLATQEHRERRAERLCKMVDSHITPSLHQAFSLHLSHHLVQKQRAEQFIYLVVITITPLCHQAFSLLRKLCQENTSSSLAEHQVEQESSLAVAVVQVD